MHTVTLAEIAEANRPAQFILLQQLIDLFASSGAVTHLLVRGSLAAGMSDRMSDIDLVVGVHDKDLPTFATHLDALMGNSFGTLLPGWVDTIVPNFGGVGYVYLLPYEDHLYQVDLYLAPSDAAPGIVQRTGAGVLLERDPRPAVTPHDRQRLVDFLQQSTAPAGDCVYLLTQAVITHAMLSKRIARGQRFLAYALLHQLHLTTRDLVRAALAPHRWDYGWYHIEREIGRSPVGRECLDALAAAISEAPVPTAQQADESLRRTWAIAERIAPQAVEQLKDAWSVYFAYQELGT